MSELWSDSDVSAIYVVENGAPQLLLHQLDGEDRRLIHEFIEMDGRTGGYASAEDFRNACLAGVRAVEGVTAGSHLRGWKKFVTYMTGANAWILWDSFHDDAASAVGGWVMESLESLGVRPDGGATAFGSMYLQMMGIPGSTTVLDGTSGQIKVRGGDDARRQAGAVTARRKSPDLPSAAQWLADPYGRHQYRYFDGVRWTEHVSDKGVTATDPV